MSESKIKAPRSMQEIQAEHQNLCLRAGYLQYQVYISKKDLDLVNDTLRELNAEAFAANQAAQQAAAKAQADAQAKELETSKAQEQEVTANA